MIFFKIAGHVKRFYILLPETRACENSYIETFTYSLHRSLLSWHTSFITLKSIHPFIHAQLLFPPEITHTSFSSISNYSMPSVYSSTSYCNSPIAPFYIPFTSPTIITFSHSYSPRYYTKSIRVAVLKKMNILFKMW